MLVAIRHCLRGLCSRANDYSHPFYALVVRSGDYYLFETDSEEEEEEEEKRDDEPPKKSAFQVRKSELYSK